MYKIKHIAGTIKPNYNVTPGQLVSSIINDDGNRLVEFQWGLIPFWAKDPSIRYKLINARSETVAEKPSFKNALKKRRCLILADGYYEWEKNGNKKTPMFIRLKNQQPFGMAGLWEMWNSPEGKNIYTCTIVTMEANDLLRPIHPRMPVIIQRELESEWLDPDLQDPRHIVSLLHTYPQDNFESYKVSSYVNFPANNSPECIKPVSDSED